jgi:NodT family efflux transporter outer membrane factor (OMF) lipoprotein
MKSILKCALKINKYIILIFILPTFSGCVTVGPDYQRPEVALPGAWNQKSSPGAVTASLDVRALANWWSTLNDPVLSSLIDRAIKGNLDLRKAKARVREARAQRGISVAGQFPSVDARAAASWSRNSESTGTGTTQDLYSAGFDATWELDLFGGKRRSVEASQGDLEASEEDLRDVLVTLISETAQNYVDVRAYQTRLAIAEANRDAQQETYQITQWRFEAGLTTKLDEEQARYNLEQTRSQIPTLEIGLEKAKNRLALLLGKHPGILEAELSERKPLPAATLEIAIGVPADVLRNRPDVRNAERKLAAQTARIGAATAELYPKVTLTGSIGVETLSAEKLFSAGNHTFGIGPAITWNIFDAGSIRKNIEVQNALQEQTLIKYEAAILSALEEVNNTLAAYAREQSRRQALFEAVQAATRAVELANSRYESGLIDFSVVLDAQRSLLTFQDTLASSEASVLTDLISLYKALGGGWTPMSPTPTAPDEEKSLEMRR